MRYINIYVSHMYMMLKKNSKKYYNAKVILYRSRTSSFFERS